MVFLGIGILVASLSVFWYKHRVSATWTQKKVSEMTDHTLREAERDKRTENPVTKERSSIPSFQLDEGDEKGYAPAMSEDAPQALQPAAIPQTMSAPQANAKKELNTNMMPPPAPLRPTDKDKPDHESNTLRPAPSLPIPTPPTFKKPPIPSTNLRSPPSAASTLRSPTSLSLAPPSAKLLSPTTSTLSPSSRPSKKVLLDPGHSPLDWAHLTANPPSPTFLRGKDVPPQLIRVPPSLLKYHTGRKGKDAWGVWQGKVYNLTPYMEFHPGGVAELMRGAGKEKDGERLFNEVHPWISWENMLAECLVGILVSEAEGKPDAASTLDNLEEMD